MTVAVQPTFNPYTGNGVTTNFAFQFLVLDEADLTVYVDGVVQTLNVDYSVSGVGAATGGTVSFLLAAPGNTLPVSIVRTMEAKRTTDYQQQGDFNASTVNPDFDRAILLIQDLHTQIGRSIRTPPDEVGTIPTLPSIAARAGLYIGFDALGQPIVLSGTGNDSALRTDLASSIALSAGASLVGFRSSLAGATARTALSKMRDIVEARDFGVTANGVTDDTAALQAAAASGAKYIVLPEGSVKATGTINVAAGQRWYGNNTNFITTGAAFVLFAATALSSFSFGGRITVNGDNLADGSLAGTGAALHIEDCTRFDVEGITTLNFRGGCISVTPGANTAARAEKGTIRACQAHGCSQGWIDVAGTGAEYITVEGFYATRCAIGVSTAAGNITFIGCNIDDNALGWNLVNGANHGHGKIFGCNSNHNVTQVKANTVTNGQPFIGCNFFQGIIHLDHSTGVDFLGGMMDVDAYRFEESDGCGFYLCLMTDTYPNTITNDYNASHSYTVWRGCHTKTGQPWRGALGNVKGIRVTNSHAVNQVFAAAAVNATAVIKLDTKVVASANQASQTAVAYLAAHDVTTGTSTGVKGGDGKARYDAQLVITCNAADAGKFQVFLTHSTLGDFYLDLVPTAPAAAATSWIAKLDKELPIDIGQTLTLKITGTGVANNVTVTNSGGTKAQIEGL